MFFKCLRADLAMAKAHDPAARNKAEILFCYSGVHALMLYRVAHALYQIKLKFLARCLSAFTRFLTGIEIHPAAKIEGGVLIDHGAGVVIGETAEVKKGVILYQGVTLGANGKETGKRHPTVMENVVIGAGAKLLGGFTVGKNAMIGAGAVVLSPVPENATFVGVPAKNAKAPRTTPTASSKRKKRKKTGGTRKKSSPPKPKFDAEAEILSLKKRLSALQCELKKEIRKKEYPYENL